MKLNAHDLPPHIQRLNPHLFGVAQLESAKSKPKAALDRPAPAAEKRKAGPGWRVAITAHVGKQWDGDNLQAGCKQVRDGIAEFLGVDDNDGAVEWRYGQCVNPQSPGIRVEIWQLT